MRSEGCGRLPSAGRPWPAPYVKRRRPQRQAAEGGRRCAAAAPLRYLATASAPGQPTPRSISFRPGARITSARRGSALVLWVGEQPEDRSGFWGPEDPDTMRLDLRIRDFEASPDPGRGRQGRLPPAGALRPGLAEPLQHKPPPHYTCPRPLFTMSWNGWSGRLNIKTSIKKKKVTWLFYVIIK